MKTRKMNTGLPDVQAAIAFLQTSTFPSDDPGNPQTGHWWITWDGDVPAAFASIQSVPSWGNTFYVERTGVLAKYRGQRIQRKLLKTIEHYAKKSGAERLITTTFHNPASANNMIACGFKTYEPQHPWGADGTIYWIKEF
jgi:GNAT superfamily N-acetyltransferase